MTAGTRVLVTGGSGMVGANLVHRLVAEGHQASVLLRPTSNRIRLQPVDHELDILHAEMTDRAAVQASVTAARPHVVFHLAGAIWGRTPAASAAEHCEVNTLGTLHLLEALRACPGVRFIFAGSSAVYGGGSQLHESQPLAPGSIYGASKAAASLLVQTYARLYQMQTVELRLFMPYGPWEHPSRLIPQTILSALAGADIPMTQGTQQRDLVYMDDVVEALILAATKALPPGSIFNIGSGIGVPVRRVVEALLSLMGNPVKPLVGALPMRPDEIMEMSADITAARAQLGWEPRVSLEDGLRKSIAWFREHREFASQLTEYGSARPGRKEIAVALIQ